MFILKDRVNGFSVFMTQNIQLKIQWSKQIKMQNFVHFLKFQMSYKIMSLASF